MNEKKLKLLNEMVWEEVLKEAIPKLVLEPKSEAESGFCQFNRSINEYAQANPDNLAITLIFVVASQQVSWNALVPRFPILVAHIKGNDGLVPEEGGRFALPKEVGALMIGKSESINALWKNRERIYTQINPLIQKFNNAKSSDKEEAAFDIYVKIMGLPMFGLPKAAFAMQLITGRYGCIDSINASFLQISPALVKMEKDNKGQEFMVFRKFEKKVDPSDTTNIIKMLSKSGVNLAIEYVKYLKELEKLAGDDISKLMWDNWVEIVAAKLNSPGEDFDVEIPGMTTGSRIRNQYAKKFSPDSPSKAFVEKYKDTHTGLTVSRQHHPEQMYEGKKIKIRRK